MGRRFQSQTKAVASAAMPQQYRRASSDVDHRGLEGIAFDVDDLSPVVREHTADELPPVELDTIAKYILALGSLPE
jgi:hypothetical protein